MSLSDRRLRSARQSRQNSPRTPPSTNNQDEGGAEQAPPKKEQKKRRQHRRQNSHQEAPSQETTVASGRNVSAPAGQAGQTIAEEDEDEDATDEDVKQQATVATRQSKRRRPQSLHASPDLRKRTRRQSLRTTALSQQQQQLTDSGDERDISDLDLEQSDGSDEEGLLRNEARHLIAEYEQDNQSDADDSEGSLSADEGLVFEITNISQNGEDMLLSWSEAEGELYRAPLEDFLALAEDPLEGGVISSMWYQDAPDADEEQLEDDDLESLRDSEDSELGLDIDEATDQLFFMRGIQSDTEEDDDMFTDDGETTDSLDDGDELALIRFGIEVDEDEHALSLSPFEIGETTIDMDAFAKDPEAVIAKTARKLGVNHETAIKIITGVSLSVMAQKRSATPRKQITANGEPEMGEFTSSRAKGSNVVIDSQASPVPSPFSAKRMPRRRRESQGSPISTRSRRLSVMSSQSSQSLTPVESQESRELESSPLDDLAEEHLSEQMELEDVLHDDVLEPLEEEASEPSESEAGAEDNTDLDAATLAGAIQLDDLERWDRVPIGAFRRSRGDHSPRSSVPNSRRRYVPVYKGSPVLLPAKRAAKGKGAVKLSPKATRNPAATKQKKVSPVSQTRGRPSSLRKVSNYLSSSPRTRSRATTPRVGSSSWQYSRV